jgi:PAS domain-containing protein
MAQKNPTWTREYRFLCADGNYKNVLDRGFVIFDDQTGDPVRMIGAMQDITERAAYTQQMEEHIERLKDIAWTQAHLVRDPLSQILAIISLLMNFEYDEDTRKDLLCKVDTAAQSLDKTVKQIILKSETALKGISDETSH